ncbi:MAG: HEXXH motif domain-containing protein [Actinomycetota bacterium]|nr:HEXXH motif domain-containing protein [Actinomycetota bacterium]
MSSQRTDVAPRHRISLQLLDETFAGPVSASTMARLQAGQQSRRLLLVKVVQQLVSDADSWDVLVAADTRSPEAVRRVLAYPAVGTWLVRAIHKARGTVSDDMSPAAELGYLGSVAMAAAIGAGLPAAVEVPVWHGRVNLPTIGQFEVGDAVQRATVVHADSGTYIETDGGRAVPLDELSSAPLRRHRSAVDGVEVHWTIDDIDPYRAFSAVEAPARLNDAEYGHWCGLLDEAWALLVRHHPAYAAELAQVDPVIVPVPVSRGLVASSSSSSFGAIIIATPESGAALAETLVHELQHSKLNAVLDLVRLEEDPARLCYAPWRKDPRPLPGLLHGIYAFTSVAEFWRVQRHIGGESRRAVLKFLYHREQVRAALRVVDAMPWLTEFGLRFVDVIQGRLAACDTYDVPGDIAETVALLLAVHRFTWRLRHLAPPDGQVAAWTRRLLAGDAPPPEYEPVLEPNHRAERDTALSALLMAKALDADRYAALPAKPGERALVEGRRDEAVRTFSARIAADPDDDGAWVGLFAALPGADENTPVETVAATYRHLVATGADEQAPNALAAWSLERAAPG